jgi:Pyridoxamine 5'-phosphate oxidase
VECAPVAACQPLLWEGPGLRTFVPGAGETRRAIILGGRNGLFPARRGRTTAGSRTQFKREPVTRFIPSRARIVNGGVEMTQQGSLELLSDPVAKALLESVNPARLAYTWMDGSPRVVPIWFHWTGDQFVLGTPPKAPKLRALAADPRVALTIDDNQWPHKVLLVRGRASVGMLDDVSPEYELSAARYFGPEQGGAWVSTLRGKPMARIAITPGWVGILDFQTRFPSALTL